MARKEAALRQSRETELLTGRIVRIDSSGQVWVDYPGNRSGPQRARVTRSLGRRNLRTIDETKQDVLLALEPGHRPLLIDLVDDVASPLTLVPTTEQAGSPSFEGARSLRCTGFEQGAPEALTAPDDAKVNGVRLTFDAHDQIVFRCGKASITLTRAGKVLVRGTYISQRSSGVNRIRGGSVEIN